MKRKFARCFLPKKTKVLGCTHSFFSIYVMYILFSEGYIQRYSPDTEVIFRPRQKKKPEGRALPCPRVFFCRGRNKAEVEVAISLYTARRKSYI